ncbi:MAG: hypothetical protein PHD48_09590, partial [Alphaproteobacteria bacterium]|nr:hypothetical protein [Alphaproteobacteria bacterium]
MNIISLVSAAGIGAILATIIHAWLTERKEIRQRIFQEKKEAYLGFLNAMYVAEITPSEENQRKGGYWVNVCRIVASKEVNDLLEKHLATNPIDGHIHPDRPAVLKELYAAMRK